MLELTHFSTIVAARRNPLLALLKAIRDVFRARPFASMEDQKLSDHHWAVNAALMRAIRTQDLSRIADLHALHTAFEREMRRRHRL